MCFAGAAGPGEGGGEGCGGNITDEQVVASMQKGIDYLLSVKKGDNWESGKHPGAECTGEGETLVLYALLHAGESLQDDPDYHAKLHWRGPALAPVIAWLSKITPRSTYSAWLEAKPCVDAGSEDSGFEAGGRASQEAPLDACTEIYLIEAMGHDGGYSYISWLYNKADNDMTTRGHLGRVLQRAQEAWGQDGGGGARKKELD